MQGSENGRVVTIGSQDKWRRRHLNSRDSAFQNGDRFQVQSLPRVVGPYTLSNLCQRLYAKNLGKISLLKGNLI